MFELCLRAYWRFMSRLERGGCDHVWSHRGYTYMRCPKCNMPWKGHLRQPNVEA